MQITLAGGKRKTIRLDELSPVQARQAGVGRFRYAAFVVHGSWCTERLVSQNAAGKTLWDSGTDEYPCNSSG